MGTMMIVQLQKMLGWLSVTKTRLSKLVSVTKQLLSQTPRIAKKTETRIFGNRRAKHTKQTQKCQEKDKQATDRKSIMINTKKLKKTNENQLKEKEEGCSNYYVNIEQI